MNKKTALILEGGSFRSLFTSGVLDTFLANDIEFPCVGGVSAGSLCGANYVARQIGRTAKVNFMYVNDKRYLGFHSLIKNHSFINFDFLLNEVSNELVPFDYKTFEESKQRFVAFSTDCKTGGLKAFEKGKTEDIFLACRSSCSLPLISPIVSIEGGEYLDGGITMPIPVQWAIDEGYEKIVVVLTRQNGFRKEPVKTALKKAYERCYKGYPELRERLMHVPDHYNALQEQVDTWEKRGQIFVIRPKEPVTVARMEKDVDKLKELYQIGKDIAEDRLEDMLAYIKE